MIKYGKAIQENELYARCNGPDVFTDFNKNCRVNIQAISYK